MLHLRETYWPKPLNKHLHQFDSQVSLMHWNEKDQAVVTHHTAHVSRCCQACPAVSAAAT
jgi:hypothetical protein